MPPRKTTSRKPPSADPPEDNESRNQDARARRTQGPSRQRQPEPVISGNLCFDPELRFTPSGKAVCKLRVAVNHRKKNEKTGKWEEGDPSFHDVVVWEDQAENVVESVQKGTRIIAFGRWQTREWTDDEDKNHEVTELVAREVGLSMLWTQFPLGEYEEETDGVDDDPPPF